MKTLEELHERIKDAEILHRILIDMVELAKHRNVHKNLSIETLLNIQIQHNKNIENLVMEITNQILYNKDK
tara:strand:+ start:84 stop:296 length:213 start_codon:yes stop_codon:yes gene_type:complete